MMDLESITKMVWRLAVSIIFISKFAMGEYQIPKAAIQPIMTIKEPDINPKPGCYPIYQPQSQSPICATFPQPIITTGIIRPQRQDPSSRLSNDLIRLIKSIPSVSEKLSSFLEYNGITEPWPEALDFGSDEQRRMPKPEPMFSKMQKLVGVFEGFKEYIDNELFKIEKYVRRGKAYLGENFDDLKRYHSLLKEYLRRLRIAKTTQAKNEYSLKFSELYTRTQEKIRAYLDLKSWLQTTVRLFRSLF